MIPCLYLHKIAMIVHLRKFLLLLGLAGGIVPLTGELRMSEFLAANESGIRDEDGDFSDWIEIHNPTARSVSLEGYSLSDEADDPSAWKFPARMIEPGEYLVVFASGKNRVSPSGELHTTFRLSASGGYLGFSGPSGMLTEFSPVYPEQSDDVSFGLIMEGGVSRDVFFNAPSPGVANSGGQAAGPLFLGVTENLTRPLAGQDVLITARFASSLSGVAAAVMHYRVMFGAEKAVPMADNGVTPDLVAGDGLFSAIIPGTEFEEGEMIRWRIEAEDDAGNQSREPPFKDPSDSHQYVGTVAVDSAVDSLLPVVEKFIENPGASETREGTRGALFFLGELYDNVFFNRHGQSTAGPLFLKKSFNIDFNKTQRFRWRIGEQRVKDMDLLTNWADKSKARHMLAWEIMREAGVPAHEAFTVRVQRNGEFFGTLDFMEDPDEIYLERAGLNPEGALYKIYNIRLQPFDVNRLTNDDTLDAQGNKNADRAAEKKNRREENRDDFREFINGLHANPRNSQAQWDFIYDNVSISRMVNLAAAYSIIRETDLQSKNWYFYRDSGRSDEWSILPWDLDLSQGRRWNFTDEYFDNQLFTTGVIEHGTVIDLLDIMWDRPEIRSMIHRRIRTLADRFLNTEETPYEERFYETRLDEILALIDPPEVSPSDAQLDFERWGSWIDLGDGVNDFTRGTNLVPYLNSDPQVETMQEAVDRFKNEYLPGRRDFIESSPLIPDAQEAEPVFTETLFVEADTAVRLRVPIDGTEDGSWMRPDYDDSGWLAGTMGVGFDRGPKYLPLIGRNTAAEMTGAVLRPGIYLRIEFELDDPRLFQQLRLRMQYDDGFVAYLNGEKIHEIHAPASAQWDSVASGSNEAVPEEFESFDVSAHLAKLVRGRNILAIHGMNVSAASNDFLIVAELLGGVREAASSLEPLIEFGAIDFNPASGDQDQEYVELVNRNSIAVDLSDWEIAGGIRMTLPPGTVIPANSSLYLTPTAKSFRARAASPKGGEGLYVVEGYRGHLSSFGETLQLIDPSGSVNSLDRFLGDPSEAQQFLLISELMYHPEPDGLAEYIELMNISDSVTLDLTGVSFTKGISFDFSEAAIRSLGPGERLLVVKDVAAFEAAHGSGLAIAGVFANDSSLSNGGETIKLEDAQGGTILEFTYNDKDPWPTSADTEGRSLVFINPEDYAASSDAATEAGSWRASFLAGGSPGAADQARFFAGDPDADLDGDGLSALLEFAAGTSELERTEAIAFAGVLESEGLRYPTFSYRSDPTALGISRLIESSLDLVSWEEVSEQFTELPPPSSSAENASGSVLRTFQHRLPLPENAQRFYRLKVEVNVSR